MSIPCSWPSAPQPAWPGAAASSHVLESLLHGVATDDLLTFVAAPLVLVAVALVACWFSARRATRVDPIEALRIE